MRLPIKYLGLMLLLSACASSQVLCGRQGQPGSPIEMKVKLSIAGPSDLDVDAGSGGMSTAGSNPTGGAGTSAAGLQEFKPAMQLRVELQDEFGGRLQESVPSSEGTLTFTVCNKSVYRLRITGNDIEETTAQNLAPGRGDRLVNIDVRRKQDTRKQGHKGTVAASRLNIPKKALKSFQRGNSALAASKFAEARTFYEQAIKDYPQYDQAYNNLGVALMQSGDEAGGKAAFEKAVAINGHFGRALSNLSRIALDEKDYAKALDEAKRSLTIEPLHTQTLLLATRAAFFASAYADCVAYARALHSLPHTGMGIAHYFSARSLEKQDQRAQAIAEFQLFLNEDPSDPNVPQAQMAIVELQASMQPAVN